MANDNKTIQRMILEKIKAEGLSQAKVQRDAGVNQTYIRDLGKGQRFDSIAVSRIAKAIGISPATLLGVEAPPTSHSPDGSDELRLYDESEIRRAVMAAIKGTANHDPKFLADLVVTVLNARALEVSDYTSEPDILKTG